MENIQNDFICTETPRIRRFYEKYSKRGYETPLPQINNFLQLLTSPIDGQPFFKLQYMTLRQQDILTNQIENTISAIKARSLYEFGHLRPVYSSSKTCETAQKTGIEQVIYNSERPEQQLNFSNEKAREDASFARLSQHEIVNGSSTGSEEQENSVRDITAQINNNSTSSFDYSNEDLEHGAKDNRGRQELRKRKRKSNQQLEILKCEFERDGFWSKDKILNVARITGLSESQVYKWCWDQKKKKEADIRHEEIKGSDNISECSRDKENFSPKEKPLGIHKNSKHIFKTKNASSMDAWVGESMEKYKLKKCQKIRTESTIPKRIDFSSE